MSVPRTLVEVKFKNDPLIRGTFQAERWRGSSRLDEGVVRGVERCSSSTTC